MEYTLMHKDISVADIDLDEATGFMRKIRGVYRPEHLPLGTVSRKGDADRSALNAWWLGRSIPASRSGVREALERLGLPDTRMLLTRCFGLSLSDQYWIRPKDSDMQWENVNFFTNPFSEDIGDILLGKDADRVALDFSSPDNTSDGCLRKRWKIIDGKRCLLKAGRAPFMQQPFNEVAAAIVARRLGISHVPYSLLWDDGIPYSVCEDFVTPDTELISAWRVMSSMKKSNSASVYRHYLDCCDALGVPGAEQAVNEMIVLDYLIANEDRHQNNFGLVRDAGTLEWIGPAPVFDSGSCLGYDKLPNQILSARGIECKPFRKTHEEQLALAAPFDWIDFGRLRGVEDEIRVIFDQAGEYMDEARKNVILSAFSSRLRNLEFLAFGGKAVPAIGKPEAGESVLRMDDNAAAGQEPGGTVPSGDVSKGLVRNAEIRTKAVDGKERPFASARFVVDGKAVWGHFFVDGPDAVLEFVHMDEAGKKRADLRLSGAMNVWFGKMADVEPVAMLPEDLESAREAIVEFDRKIAARTLPETPSPDDPEHGGHGGFGG